MELQIIRVITEERFEEKLDNLIAKIDIIESWKYFNKKEHRISLSLLVPIENIQGILDKVENICGRTSDSHILVLPVAAAISPELRKWEAKQHKKVISKAVPITREELYNEVNKGAELGGNFILLVILSTIVAAIGLLENHTTIIIGAMVIAPMLGPNLAMSFATTLGDLWLMKKSIRTNLTGIVICVLLSYFIGYIWPYGFHSMQLLFRTDVGYDGLVLALVSGAAAVLSLTAGLSNILVGVMVSAALLPPASTLGIMLGAGDYHHVTGAALLLAVNIVSINFAGNVVFLYKGIRPSRWYEKKRAQKAVRWNLIFWMLMLMLLGIAIYFRHGLLFI